MRFKDLAIGDEFDFIDDANPMHNSFFDRVKKISARKYVSLQHPDRTYSVGSTCAQVFHVTHKGE